MTSNDCYSAPQIRDIKGVIVPCSLGKEQTGRPRKKVAISKNTSSKSCPTKPALFRIGILTEKKDEQLSSAYAYVYGGFTSINIVLVQGVFGSCCLLAGGLGSFVHMYILDVLVITNSLTSQVWFDHLPWCRNCLHLPQI